MPVSVSVPELGLYYTPPPNNPPNVAAAFMSNFLAARNRWVMPLFRARLAQLSPKARMSALAELARERTRTVAEIAATIRGRERISAELELDVGETLRSENSMLGNFAASEARLQGEQLRSASQERQARVVTSERAKSLIEGVARQVARSAKEINQARAAGDQEAAVLAFDELARQMDAAGSEIGRLDPNEQQGVNERIGTLLQGAPVSIPDRELIRGRIMPQFSAAPAPPLPRVGIRRPRPLSERVQDIRDVQAQGPGMVVTEVERAGGATSSVPSPGGARGLLPADPVSAPGGGEPRSVAPALGAPLGGVQIQQRGARDLTAPVTERQTAGASPSGNAPASPGSAGVVSEGSPATLGALEQNLRVIDDAMRRLREQGERGVDFFAPLPGAGRPGDRRRARRISRDLQPEIEQIEEEAETKARRAGRPPIARGDDEPVDELTTETELKAERLFEQVDPKSFERTRTLGGEFQAGAVKPGLFNPEAEEKAAADEEEEDEEEQRGATGLLPSKSRRR